MFGSQSESIEISSAIILHAEMTAVHIPSPAENYDLNDIVCQNRTFLKSWRNSIANILTNPFNSLQLSWQAYREYILIVDESHNQTPLRVDWEIQITRDIEQFASLTSTTNFELDNQMRSRIFADFDPTGTLQYRAPVDYGDSSMSRIL